LAKGLPRLTLNCAALGHGITSDSWDSNGAESAEGQNRTGDTMIFSHVLYQLSYLGTSRYSKPVTPVILVTILVAVVLAGLVGFIGVRLSTGRSGETTTVTAVFLLAITFAIVAIASITFIRKTVGG
jgi:hypothetical protein